MSKAIYSISLDLHKTQSQESLYAKQGDTDREIHITLLEGGIPYMIERGTFAVLSTITPGGNVVEENCVIIDNKIVYAFSHTITAESGVMDVEIRLYDKNSNLIITPVFTFVVSPRIDVGNKVIGSDSFVALDEMYMKTNELKERLEEKLENGELVGEPAGFGNITATAQMVPMVKPPAVEVKVDGPDTAKNIYFKFSVPMPKELSCEVDPIFANNSWETIAWVSKNDDPSKYWKVGDYKMLSYPEVTRQGFISNATAQRDVFFLRGGTSRPTGNSLGKIILNNPSKLAKTIHDKFGNTYTGSSYYYRIFTEYSHPSEPSNTITTFAYLAVASNTSGSPLERVTDSMPFEKLLKELGMNLSKTNSNWDNYASIYNINKHGIHSNIGWTYEAGKVYPAKEYPVMILGFNHDNVTDIASYGKQKAGMTLCLGISRGANGLDKAAPPYKWTSEDGNILPNLYESGVSHFGSSRNNDTLLSPYHKGDGANWKNSEFRATIQSLLNGTEIENKIVAVDKITAEGKYRADRNYFSREFSSDKISLLSEYEIHGMVKHSCAQEGEWYDFFKRGNSRFFWDSRMCNKEASQLLLWSRSPRGDQDTEPLKTKGACVLYCADVLAVEESTSSDIGVTVVNPKTLINYIKKLDSSEMNYYGEYTLYTITDGGDEGTENAFGLHIAKDGKWWRHLYNEVPESALASFNNLLASIGLSTTSDEGSTINNVITFNIGHGSQVDYKPDAWGNAGYGILLPIFCL